MIIEQTSWFESCSKVTILIEVLTVLFVTPDECWDWADIVSQYKLEVIFETWEIISETKLISYLFSCLALENDTLLESMKEF